MSLCVASDRRWLLCAGLPTGLQLLARPWDEANLLKFAYAYEQHTRHRRPPKLSPVAAVTMPMPAAPSGKAAENAGQIVGIQAAESGR